MTDIVPSSIATSDGRLFNPFTVTAADGAFDIHVIAHALSMQCRYAGHTSRFYSVAEHSLLVEQVVSKTMAMTRQSPALAIRRSTDKTLRIRRWALVHDAEEAYLPDMPAPYKHRPVLAFSREAGEVLRALAGVAAGYGRRSAAPGRPSRHW